MGRSSVPLNRRRHFRAVTLVEVLIVVAIIALIAGGVGIAAFERYRKAQRDMTRAGAVQVRAAVRAWWLEHEPTECPDFDELVRSAALDEGSRRGDAWGEPWSIQCVEGRVTVSSAGPDRQLGTSDDIRVPASSG